MTARFFSARLILAVLLCCGGKLQAFAVAPPDPKKWAAEIAAFEAADRTNPPPANAILFAGASSFRLWTNLAETFPDWTLIRRGFGGAHLSDLNYYFDQVVLKYRPRKLVIYGGENDIAAGRSSDEVYAEFKEFARRVRAELPETELYYLSMKLSPSRWYLSPQIKDGNAKIRHYSRTHPRVHFIDVASVLLSSGRPDRSLFQKDELHLNDKGYDLWAREIRRSVKH